MASWSSMRRWGADSLPSDWSRSSTSSSTVETNSPGKGAFSALEANSPAAIPARFPKVTASSNELVPSLLAP